MTVGIIIALAAGGAVVLFIGWAIAGYNGLVRLKAFVDEAWSGIEVQLKRRYDLIPNLVSVVKGYSFHEKGILEEIARARAASIGATRVGEKSVAEAGLTQSLKTLFAVAEQYPDLKANQNFLALQKDLSKIEEEVQFARRYYNGAVRNYNVVITQFPSRIIATYGGFEKASYFELGAAHEREVPTIQF